MLIWTIIKISIRSLIANKLRSFLAILGIIIGVGAVISMMALGNGAQKKVMKDISSMGTNLLIVRPGQSRGRGVMSGSMQTLKVSDAMSIAREIENVQAVSPSVNSRAQVKYMNKNSNTTVIGGAVTYFSIRNFQIDVGRIFTENEAEKNARVAVLGSKTVENLFGKNDPIGQTIKVKGINFRVIGILQSKGEQGWFNPDDQIIIPYSTAMKQIAGVDYLNEIDVEVKDKQTIDEVSLKLEKHVRKLHRIQGENPNDFSIQNQAEMLKTMTNVTGTFTLLLSGIAGISLLVGGIGIMNIMLVTVTERIREIGIRKSIGAKDRDILRQFLLEAILMSAIGGLFGVAFGCGISALIAKFAPIVPVIEIQSIILSISISASIGIFFGYYPAWRAAKLNPIEALRHE